MISIAAQFYSSQQDAGSSRVFSTLKEYCSEYILVCRKKYNLTQEKLAENLNVTSVTVSNWENPIHTSMPNKQNEHSFLTLERKLWLKDNWVNLVPDLETPGTKAIKTLLLNGEDEEAQNLAEYLLNIATNQTDKVSVIFLHHIAGLSYAFASDQKDEKGQFHATTAFQMVRNISSGDVNNKYLLISVRNELLGYQFKSLTTISNIDERIRKAKLIIDECYQLYFDSDKIGKRAPILLWNALECACFNKLDTKFISQLIDKLIEDENRNERNSGFVLKRIKKDRVFEYAIPNISINKKLT